LVVQLQAQAPRDLPVRKVSWVPKEFQVPRDLPVNKVLKV
jgi:hypothetical protein